MLVCLSSSCDCAPAYSFPVSNSKGKHSGGEGSITPRSVSACVPEAFAIATSPPLFFATDSGYSFSPRFKNKKNIEACSIVEFIFGCLH